MNQFEETEESNNSKVIESQVEEIKLSNRETKGFEKTKKGKLDLKTFYDIYLELNNILQVHLSYVFGS